jgi:hypothetical protein
MSPTPARSGLTATKMFFVELFRKTVALELRTAELSTMAAELE